MGIYLLCKSRAISVTSRNPLQVANCIQRRLLLPAWRCCQGEGAIAFAGKVDVIGNHLGRRQISVNLDDSDSESSKDSDTQHRQRENNKICCDIQYMYIYIYISDLCRIEQMSMRKRTQVAQSSPDEIEYVCLVRKRGVHASWTQEKLRLRFCGSKQGDPWSASCPADSDETHGTTQATGLG